MKLTLIRHTSVDVPVETCYGRSDVPLKDTFEAEAAVVRGRLEGQRFDRVFTSPLSRCTRLAAACGYPDAIRDPRLMEINFGEWELKRWDEISDPRLQEWFDDYFTVEATGGESFEGMRGRVEAFLNDIASVGGQDESVAVFTHGGVILQVLLICGYVTPAEAFSSLAPYGGIVEVTL